MVMFLLLLLGLKTVTTEKLTGTEPSLNEMVYFNETVEDYPQTLESLKEGHDIKDDITQKDGIRKDIYQQINNSKKPQSISINGAKLKEQFIITGNNTKPTENHGQRGKVTNSKLSLPYDEASEYNSYNIGINDANPVINKQTKSQKVPAEIQYKAKEIHASNMITSVPKNRTRNRGSFIYTSMSGANSRRFERRNSTEQSYGNKTIQNRFKNREPNDSMKEKPTFFFENIDANSKTLDQLKVITPKTFSHSYNTSNGIHKEEVITAVNGVKVVGSYSYVGDDGNVYAVKYTADENGFRPQGDHLPKLPSLPKTTRHVKEQNEKDKADIYDDGSYDEAKYGHLNYENLFIRRAYKNGLRDYNYKQNITANENNTKIYSQNNKNTTSVKQIHKIKRKPRRFSVKNGFHKLRISVDTQSIEQTKPLQGFDEVSSTYSTIGYIYGPPLKQFNNEEKFYDHNQAADKIINNNANTNKVKTNFFDNQWRDHSLQNISTEIIHRDILRDNSNDFQQIFNINNDGNDRNNSPSVKYDDDLKAVSEYPDPENAFNIFINNVKNTKDLKINELEESNITDEHLLSRKLFGNLNDTKTDNFKHSPQDNKKELKQSDDKSLFGHTNLARVNDKANQTDIETILKSIFGQRQDEEKSNMNNNENLRMFDKNQYLSEEFILSDAISARKSKQNFSESKQTPKFDSESDFTTNN